MIFTFLAGIVGFGAFSQSKTRSDRPLFWTALLMASIAIIEAIISLAWEISWVGGQLRGLWFLAALTAFPLTISIEWIAPFLEWGFYQLQIALGPISLVFFASPYALVGASLERFFWGGMIRVIAFPLLFAFNLLALPIVLLPIRLVKQTKIKLR